jgi:hypothetical protein
MTNSQLQKRLEAVEHAIAALQRITAAAVPRRWWAEDAGRFANDPVFDRIVQAGQKYRRAQRPK